MDLYRAGRDQDDRLDRYVTNRVYSDLCRADNRGGKQGSGFQFFFGYCGYKESPLSRVFDFDWRSGQNTVKQFLAGVAITVCLNGLDQNMMQKNLTCRSLRDCKTNMFSFSFLFLVTNVLF